MFNKSINNFNENYTSQWLRDFQNFLEDYESMVLMKNYLKFFKFNYFFLKIFRNNFAVVRIYYRGQTHQKIIYRNDYTFWEFMCKNTNFFIIKFLKLMLGEYSAFILV